MNVRKIRRSRGGFTFAEILAAMLFLALVIPTAMQAIRISSDAGTMASRRSVATRLGDALLTELAITDEWRTGTQSGQFDPPYQDYRWQIRSENWTELGMLQLSLEVVFRVREVDARVVLTTLVPEVQSTNTVATL
jgi:hypothetical protein